MNPWRPTRCPGVVWPAKRLAHHPPCVKKEVHPARSIHQGGIQTMKPIYDAAVKEEVHKRMSPPNSESIPEIARCTGIATSTLYSWKRQWKGQGDLVPASTNPAEDWSPADKLAAVIQSTGLDGSDLGAFCRERGLYPKQLARWRQAAEDANSSSAANMSDQRELRKQNQEQARQIRRLERDLQKKEKALAEAAALLLIAKKRDALWPQNEES